MSDWAEVKRGAKRIAAKPRAKHDTRVKDPENIRPLTDRLPRPGKKVAEAKPKTKKGSEISAQQMAELKSGTARIHARLDLHGLTQREAYAELARFMDKQIARGARLLLIITGKGREMQGVLRAALPGWLMAGPWAKYILTIHPAHLRHGGDGATYVLLRKRA